MGLAAAQAKLLILTALKKPEVNKPESDNNNNVEGDLFDKQEPVKSMSMSEAQAKLLMSTILKKPESDNNNNVEGNLPDNPEAIENLIKDAPSKNFKSFA